MDSSRSGSNHSTITDQMSLLHQGCHTMRTKCWLVKNDMTPFTEPIKEGVPKICLLWKVNTAACRKCGEHWKDQEFCRQHIRHILLDSSTGVKTTFPFCRLVSVSHYRDWFDSRQIQIWQVVFTPKHDHICYGSDQENTQEVLVSGNPDVIVSCIEEFRIDCPDYELWYGHIKCTKTQKQTKIVVEMGLILSSFFKMCWLHSLLYKTSIILRLPPTKEWKTHTEIINKVYSV